MNANAAVAGLDLSVQDKILVKFFFTNEKHIPPGIPPVERRDEGVIAGAHKLEAMKAGRFSLAETGRVRAGKVDTGTPVFANLPLAHAGFIRRGLANNGFALESVHYYEKRDPGKTTKFVVVLSFVRGENRIPLDRKVQDALRALAKSVWFAHVWDNQAVGNPATVNFVGKQQEPAKNALVVRDGKLVALSGETAENAE